MELKEILKKIIFPHEIVVFLLFNISAIGLSFVFINNMKTHPLAYVMYLLSSYTLVAICVRISGIVKWWKRKLHENKYTDMYLTDKDLRMRISMYRGLIVTFVFAAFKIILGFVYDSSWFFAMAGYNIILSLMRFILIRMSQKKGLSEQEERVRGLQGYRICGWLMMVLNVAVSVIIFMVIVKKQTIEYNMIVCIGLASFTFICFTKAIIDLIKYRQRKNPIYAAVKRMDMVKAIVSIFTLQVTMLTTFRGKGAMIDIELMNMFTGVVVVIAINTIAALMIAGAKGDFRQLDNVKID